MPWRQPQDQHQDQHRDQRDAAADLTRAGVSQPEFMLAERGTEQDLDRLAASGYAFDLKVDGIRALVRVSPAASSDPAVVMTSRNGLDLTTRFPELVESLVGLADVSLVLDAEIAVPDSMGLPSWPLTQRRTAQKAASVALVRDLPARLYVFDVLEVSRTATTGEPFVRRRGMLEDLAMGWSGRLGPTVCATDPWVLWELVRDHSLEGVVAKRQNSPYRPGRSRDWVKIKATQTLSCLVGGVEWSGAAGTSELRSLQLFLVDPSSRLVAVGNASAGVSAGMRRQLRAGLRHPPLIVEVEYAEVTEAGVLRHPVVRAVRTDVDVLGASTDQLPAARR